MWHTCFWRLQLFSSTTKSSFFTTPPQTTNATDIKRAFTTGEERMRISVERVQRSRLFLVMFRSFYGVLVPLLNISRCASKGICFVKEEGGWCCCCCWILILLQVPVNWRGDFNARNLITYHTPSSSSLVSSSCHISGVQFKHHHLLEWLFNNTLSFNIVTLKHKLIHGWILLEKKRISPVTVIIFLSAETAR